MNFAEIYNEVLGIVKRPDLQERIESAIRAATLKMHQSDFYYKDMIEVPIQFEIEQCLQQFIPTDVLPQFRKAKYIRFWYGDADGAPGPFLEPIQIENSMDNYNYFRENVFYMAGANLQIRTNPAVRRVLFGAYVHPTIVPSTAYKSWIADEYPYAIIYEAARTVFRSIGFSEQANEHAQLAAEVLSEIRLSSVDDIPLT